MYEYEDYLVHHGILGQKWGVRRYQNEDGSLTEAGKNRLSKYKEKEIKKLDKTYDRSVHYGPYGVETARQGFKELNKQQIKAETQRHNAYLKSDADKMAKAQKNIDLVNSKIQKLSKLKSMETDKINKMNYDQMMKERKMIGKKVVESALLSFGATALGTFGAAAIGSPVRMAYVQTFDQGAEKTAYRLSGYKNEKERRASNQK